MHQGEELKALNNSRVGKSGDAEASKKVQKDQWGNEIEFLLSCITLSVGLGNVWRYVSRTDFAVKKLYSPVDFRLQRSRTAAGPSSYRTPSL